MGISQWRSSIEKYWPYILLYLIVYFYNTRFLGDGFAYTMDEGYLQSLGGRILDGEHPYRDFFFLRTPLSLYIQMILQYFLKANYTLLAGRIFVVVQVLIIVTLCGTIVRRYIGNAILLLVMLLAYFSITMTILFPWYSFDALFFAVIGLTLFYYRKYYLAGMAFFLAGASKQNYLLLIPLLLITLPILRYLIFRDFVFGLRKIMKVCIGFAVPLLATIIFLQQNGMISIVIDNIYYLPKEISETSLFFIVFQNHDHALRIALPIMIILCSIYYMGKKTTIAIPLAAAFVILYFDSIFDSAYNISYSLVCLNYLLMFYLINLVTRKRELNSFKYYSLLEISCMALMIQYMSCFNYGGLAFANLGAGVAILFLTVAFFIFQPKRPLKLSAIVTVGILLGVIVYHDYKYVYHELPRNRLNTEFEYPRLRGIRSSSRFVGQYTDLINGITKYSDRNDYILTYPNMPSLYFITDRRNPCSIGWFYPLEYNEEMLTKVMLEIKSKQPRLIIIESKLDSCFLQDFLNDYYTPKDTIAYFILFVKNQVYSTVR